MTTGNRLRTRRALRRLPRSVKLSQLGDRRLVVGRSFKTSDGRRFEPGQPLADDIALAPDGVGGLLARGLVVCDPALTTDDIAKLRRGESLAGKAPTKKKASKKKAATKPKPKPEPDPVLDAADEAVLPDVSDED